MDNISYSMEFSELNSPFKKPFKLTVNDYKDKKRVNSKQPQKLARFLKNPQLSKPQKNP